MFKLGSRIGVGFLTVCLCAFGALAQGGTTRLSGVVTDKNGALIEGAKVSATNEATSVTVTQVTTSGGIYSFASIAPGKYTVTIEQTGFKKNVRTGNVLQVDTPGTVDIALDIGNVSEVVTVQSEGIAVQTNTATIGNVIDQRTIETLPLNGRNPLTLLLMAFSNNTRCICAAASALKPSFTFKSGEFLAAEASISMRARAGFSFICLTCCKNPEEESQLG